MFFGIQSQLFGDKNSFEIVNDLLGVLVKSFNSLSVSGFFYIILKMTELLVTYYIAITDTTLPFLVLESLYPESQYCLMYRHIFGVIVFMGLPPLY